MSAVGCNCSKSKASSYVVKLPGQADRTVQSESAAMALTTGVRGASYSAKSS